MSERVRDTEIEKRGVGYEISCKNNTGHLCVLIGVSSCNVARQKLTRVGNDSELPGRSHSETLWWGIEGMGAVSLSFTVIGEGRAVSLGKEST